MILELIELTIFALPVTFVLVLMAVADKIKPIFKWYDLWVGFYVNREKWEVYVFYFPMCGIKFKLVPEDYTIETALTSSGKKTYIVFKDYIDDTSGYVMDCKSISQKDYWWQAWFAMQRHIEQKDNSLMQIYKDRLQ